ncbi:hypothetical protein F4780DRAFT_709152 [Xylariomycetidae sp. FL0641]|nr:hypothetical protein F4780DRAFT_709152 [Xylariomycetidae sp. FL0641]
MKKKRRLVEVPNSEERPGYLTCQVKKQSQKGEEAKREGTRRLRGRLKKKHRWDELKVKMDDARKRETTSGLGGAGYMMRGGRARALEGRRREVPGTEWGQRGPGYGQVRVREPVKPVEACRPSLSLTESQRREERPVRYFALCSVVLYSRLGRYPVQGEWNVTTGCQQARYLRVGRCLGGRYFGSKTQRPQTEMLAFQSFGGKATRSCLAAGLLAARFRLQGGRVCGLVARWSGRDDDDDKRQKRDGPRTQQRLSDAARN